jgi:hypothetical protein
VSDRITCYAPAGRLFRTSGSLREPDLDGSSLRVRVQTAENFRQLCTGEAKDLAGYKGTPCLVMFQSGHHKTQAG